MPTCLTSLTLRDFLDLNNGMHTVVDVTLQHTVTFLFLNTETSVVG